MTILAIETSCDDTAAAVLRDGVVLANTVASQTAHAAYGGVVPEIASRAHQRRIAPIVRTALSDADIRIADLDAVAATYGPGLAGSLLVGLSFAKAFAVGRRLPFIGVNHLDGHLFSPFDSQSEPDFPFLALVVSGGHTELLRVDSWTDRTLLGRTRDDAAGEAFDKVGKILGLPYPGGPSIETAAQSGVPGFRRFPRTTLPEYDYSFSGIKTSVLYHLNSVGASQREAYLARHVCDLAASFQSAMISMILSPLEKALGDTGIRTVALSGGVSANAALRQSAKDLCERSTARLHTAPPGMRTDNAAMIARVAYHLFRSGRSTPLSKTIDPSARLVAAGNH